MPRVLERSGQTVVEFVVSSSLLFITLIGAGWVLNFTWRRAECAYITFEHTHARLVGLPIPAGKVSVTLYENAQSVSGEGSCGRTREKVTLKRIQSD